jgi:molecular chaperone GrpE (heat shock protein)
MPEKSFCPPPLHPPSPFEKVLNAALLLVHVLQTVYQKKAEGFEKELVVAKQQNKRLKAKVENLRNQLEQNVSYIVDLAVPYM